MLYTIEHSIPADRNCRKKVNLIISLAHSFLAYWRNMCAKITAQVYVGEDQFYSNTSFPLHQAENAEKQVFFVILEFVNANLASLW